MVMRVDFYQFKCSIHTQTIDIYKTTEADE
jgi:hypothetical protein